MNGLIPVISVINSCYNSLTKSEKKVAEYVLENQETIIYMPISEVAESAAIGETTILRFCKKLGFSSYQEFKLSLVQDLASKEHEETRRDFTIKQGDTLEEIAEKVIGYEMSILKETLDLLKTSDLEQAKNAIIEAKKIEIYGVGASAVTGQDVALKLMRVGFNVAAYTDLHTQMMSASLLKKGDLAIGISFSGSSKDTNKVLQIARNSGAKIIAITHHTNSPITKISDITLLHGAKEDPLSGGDFSSKIAQISIFDILYHSVYLQQRTRVHESNKKTSKAITDNMF